MCASILLVHPSGHMQMYMHLLLVVLQSCHSYWIPFAPHASVRSTPPLLPVNMQQGSRGCIRSRRYWEGVLCVREKSRLWGSAGSLRCIEILSSS